MLLNLPIELLHNIFIKSDKLYLITITNKYIYNMKLNLYLIPYIIKNTLYYNIKLKNLKNIIKTDYENNIFDYIKDLSVTINHLDINYKRHNKYKLVNRFIRQKTVITQYKVNFEEKKNILIRPLHPVYRCTSALYLIMKKKHLNILALIY